MPDVITASEYVEIDGVPLATPAFRCVDFHMLWTPAPVRGADRRIPYAPGEKPLRRVKDTVEHSLPLIIFGRADREGTPAASIRAGLRANWEVLAALTDPDAVVADPGTKQIRLKLPDATFVTGQCHVILLTPGDTIGGGAALRATLDIVIPAGELA